MVKQKKNEKKNISLKPRKQRQKTAEEAEKTQEGQKYFMQKNTY